MSGTETDHYPRGAPRRRLRSHPLPGPITGRLLVGEQCLRCGCPYAGEGFGFVDCARPEVEEVLTPATA